MPNFRISSEPNRFLMAITQVKIYMMMRIAGMKITKFLIEIDNVQKDEVVCY